MLPPAPPGTFWNTRKSRFVPPVAGRLNFWLVHVVVAPVDVRLAVVTIGPSGAPVRICTAPSGDPGVRPSLLSATRNVTELMFSRLIGPLISIQSPAARLPRCWPPRSGSVSSRCSCPTG